MTKLRFSRKGSVLTIQGKRYSLIIEDKKEHKFELSLMETEFGDLRVFLTAKNFRMLISHLYKLKKHLK